MPDIEVQKTINTKPEPSKIDSIYETYKADPTPDNLNSVVRELKPTIDYTLIGLNAKGDPVLTGQAQLVAAKAVKKFDPEKGAGLKTHVSNQLKQMNRYARNVRSAIRVPERYQLESHALHRAEQDFIENKGYEPSLGELSDWSALPIKRIQKIRSMPNQLSDSQTSFESEGGDKVDPGDDKPDFLDEALDYVYQGLTPGDQKIFEHMTGYAGADVLTPAELGVKLSVSQSQISRKFAKMMSKLHDIDTQLQEVNL